MGYQMVFQRYELKYLLTRRQKEVLLQAMEPYMELDRYGHTTIRNIYYDTDNYRLARHSIEHPAYKEKLRVRSYSQAAPQDPVFVELKKKYDSVVYKRRMVLPYGQAQAWLQGRTSSMAHTQIGAEIEYFRDHYQTLQPQVFLSYEREAFFSKNGDGLRITFDENIFARQEDLSLGTRTDGMPLLEKDMVLMEAKTAGAFPLWLAHLLTEHRIYKVSFSKYGTAYKTMICQGKRSSVAI